jgi:hypothetical protein
MRFPSAQVWVASPGVTIFATERLAVGARYYLAFSAFENALRTARSHSGAVRMSFQVWPRVSVNGGYARGIENFETLTLDHIGQFRADTGSAGVRLDLPSLTSAYLVYEQQRRPGAAMMLRVTLSLVQRF